MSAHTGTTVYMCRNAIDLKGNQQAGLPKISTSLFIALPARP